jgi:RNA polymerase sigma-70 factor (ECF subfamily)
VTNGSTHEGMPCPMSRPEQSSDADARMRQLVSRHCRSLTRFISAMTPGQSTEDLVQETMLRAWQNLSTLPADEQAGRRWLFTVARHVVIDDCRRRRARPVEVAPLAERATPGDLTASAAIANVALRGAVAGLSQAHRDVLIGILVEHRAPSEVAERLGIPLGTVRSRLHYAMRALRDGVSR